MTIQVPSRGAFIEVGVAEVTVGPASTLTLGSLNGDADQLYVVDVSIVHGNPGTIYDFKLLPNGLFANIDSNYVFNDGTLVSRTGQGFIVIASLQGSTMRAVFHTTQTPFGLAAPRTRAMTTIGSVPGGGIFTGGGGWSAAGNIASLVLASTGVSDTTPTNGLGVGTIMRVLKPRGPRP